MTPGATLRLQLHRDFSLQDAAGQVPYFAGLGIRHLYLSPVTRARTGSTHGYDVIDYGQVDPQLGGEDALRELALRAREHGLGLILDIVPNHMAAHPDNPWWRSVLEHGEASPHAHWFDIQWDSDTPGLRGKVLLPILSAPYGVALGRGDICLVSQGDAYFIDVHGMRLPVCEGTLCPPANVPASAPSPGHNPSSQAGHQAGYDPSSRAGRQALHELLQRQHYRLAWWQCAAEQINWRRFFEISDLAGLRVERDDVFAAVHELPLRLVEEGLVDGLRIDHVDGLAQPLAYCRRLDQALRGRMARRPVAARDRRPWLLVEKILAHGEYLDERWTVDGTTGYDFMEMVNGLLHDPDGDVPLTAVWRRISRDSRPVDAWRREARQRMVDRHFCAERDVLVSLLHQLAVTDVATRDVTRHSLGRALDRLLVEFDVYRTYVSLERRADSDIRHLKSARDRARTALAENRDLAALHALDFVSDCLLGRYKKITRSPSPARRCDAHGRDLTVAADGAALQMARREGLAQALRRFQQLTPPLAAKALEDTVLYRYGRLLSRNEVGSDPGRFSISPEGFHAWNQRRARSSSRSMNATATHDHKRGEDVRARLAVISEMPGSWEEVSTRCLAALCQHSTINPGVPAARCYMLLQMIVGAWPPDLRRDEEAGMACFVDRLQQWQLKALREAKQETSWLGPDEAVEQEQADRIEFLLCDPESDTSRQLEGFAAAIAPAGALNSLSMAVLRCNVPGVPDLYQGTELWDFSLVDPDNRRPVDFQKRQAMLHALQATPAPPMAELLSRWQDGAVKQAVIARCLHLRQRMPDVYAAGSYEPLLVQGRLAGHVLAFARCLAGQSMLVVVSRLGCRALRGRDAFLERPLVPPDLWQDTRIVIPRACRRSQWQDALSGSILNGAGNSLQVADVLTCLPVAVLVAP